MWDSGLFRAVFPVTLFTTAARRLIIPTFANTSPGFHVFCPRSVHRMQDALAIQL
jgi:hypothetical protein